MGRSLRWLTICMWAILGLATWAIVAAVVYGVYLLVRALT